MATDTARNWAHRSDRIPPAGVLARRKLTPEQIDQIKQRHANGETVRALALAYQVSAGTIRNYTAA